MDGYGQRSSENNNDDAQQGAIARFTRILGIASSLILIALVAWWAFHIGSRDAREVPVIAALEGDTRVKPEDPGGTVVEHQGLEVNSVLEGEEPALANEVKLAPSGEVDLAAVDPAIPSDGIEPTQAESEAGEGEGTQIDGEASAANSLPANEADDEVLRPLDGTQIVKPVGRPSLLYILPKDQLNPNTLEAQPIGGDTPVTDGREVTNAAVEVIKTPVELPAIDQSVVEPEPTPTETAEPATDGEDLGPRLAAGTPLIQLAANPDLADTQAQWVNLQAGNSDLLGDKALYVETTEVNGITFYRLRVQGFADAAESKVACSALLARNIDCLVVKAN